MVRPPKTPPSDWARLLSDHPESVGAALAAGRAEKRYLNWESLQYRTPPDGLTHELWWAGVKANRYANARLLPLLTKDHRHFMYTLPDEVLHAVDDISAQARGAINVPELVVNTQTRDRYLINSLMEEAITSSQLEGAVTSRREAKELLRSRRAPQNRSEQMILNNYNAMQFVREHLHETLTPALVLRLHEVVTRDALDNPQASGRLQLPGEDRVSVWAISTDRVLHEPPPAEELPERLARLCAFANAEDAETGPWLPPLLRAIITHFMVGYDHYFEDGNGRTARALFYWVALRNDYWLLEFTAISRILKGAQAKYARSYLDTESDDGDVTYFVLYQLEVIQRAIDDLHVYLAEKMTATRAARAALDGLPLNHRQIAIIEGALRDATIRFTARSHAESHDVTLVTARTDLRALQEMGLLDSTVEGRTEVWRASPRLSERLTVSPNTH